jgi:hypothetical protein
MPVRMVGLLGIAALLSAAACTASGDGGTPSATATGVATTVPSSATPSPSAPATVSWQPTEDQLATVCNGASFAQAPERAAAGARPTAVFRGDPGPWIRDQALLGGAADLGTVQQVACTSVTVLGAKVRMCDYPGSGSYELSAATYAVRLVEVRTGTEVLSKNIEGADRTCPASLSPAPNEKKLPTGLSGAQLAQALGSEVTG